MALFSTSLKFPAWLWVGTSMSDKQRMAVFPCKCHSQSTSGRKPPHHVAADCDSLRVDDDFALSRNDPNQMEDPKSLLYAAQGVCHT